MFSLLIHTCTNQHRKNQHTKQIHTEEGENKTGNTVAIHQAKRGSRKKFGAEICVLNSLRQLTTLHAHLSLAKDTPHTERRRGKGQLSYKNSYKKDDKQKWKPRSRSLNESMKRESENSVQDFSERVRTDFIDTINKRYSFTIFVGGELYSPPHAIPNRLAVAVPAFDKIYITTKSIWKYSRFSDIQEGSVTAC